MEQKDNNIYSTIDNDPGFEVEKKTPTLIKVIGVGGGGNNAVNHMYEQRIDGVSFVVVNTDLQALNMSPVPNRLLIGPLTTKGLGAGNDPELAKRAADESKDDIAELFDEETKMVFITAGMGGGTGTGAGPVVARIAHEKDKLTIGIVTIPFLFEGRKKILKALKGADEMSEYVDALLIINNQRLIDIYPDLDINNAFGRADDTLTTAARSISELITFEGTINLDFNDVNTTLRDGRVAIISSGYGEGENRVTKAIEDALNSPLLKNRDVYGSKRVLMNVYFNPDSKNPLMMDELKEIQDFMVNFSQEVDVITGTTKDTSLDDKIKVTILAAGFEMTLDGDVPSDPTAPRVQRPAANTEGTSVNSREATERLADLYGRGAIEQQDSAAAAAQYFILTPDDIENDELLDLLEHTPAFKRQPDKKKAIADLRVKYQQQQQQQQPSAEPKAPPKRGTSATIDFGSEGQ